eukprot:2282858-Rhodomonas_salina.2
MSGTDLVYPPICLRAPHIIPSTELKYSLSSIGLRTCYAMSGTDAAMARYATSSTDLGASEYPVLTQRSSAIGLHMRYAMSSTGLA